MIDQLKDKIIPQHIAIIMDGNGRWAKQQNKERSYGHQKGAETLRNITLFAKNIGVKYLTVYAFSKENWRRPSSEVNHLMSLLITGINEHLQELVDNNIKLFVLGDKDNLPADVQQAIKKAEEASSCCSGLILIVALNYSGRWEIINAVKNYVNDVLKGVQNVADLNEELFANYLLTKNIPDPDLLIRTSGEMRISNFLLWQLSYSELYITPTLWPDFNEQNLVDAILDFNKRQRRFGMTSEQLNT